MQKKPIDKKKEINKQFFLIAGPCVIESEKMCLEHAAFLKELSNKLQIPFVFKASYDKANRTSADAFRGISLKKGIAALERVKKKFNIPVTSDVHSCEEIKVVKDVLDIIQIPALLCRQTDLIIAAAKSKKTINIKKGQFLAPQDMKNVIDKVKSQGNNQIILTERGTSFGYHNLICDMRSIPIMKQFGFPVIFDATHSVQLPGAGKGKSLGQRQFVQPLALSALAAGADGLFLEVHACPEKALCDGPNMLALKNLESFLKKAKKIWEIINA